MIFPLIFIQCRISGSRVRQQLFQDEKGVCQKCACNAHELYRTTKLLSKADRRSYLEKTPFISLPVALLNKIIVDPKEGMVSWSSFLLNNSGFLEFLNHFLHVVLGS